ncbi:MAG: alpha/beta hydrolase [Oleiphilaceae bacterium]|nr:alpha/beta hydrolase [Oleiphilaceae bacterium]
MRMTEQQVKLEAGVTMRVRRWQQQPAAGCSLVLLHEALGSLDLWKGFPEQLALATGLDVVAYERRGYGESTPAEMPRPMDYLEREGDVWLPRLLDALQLQKVVLLGHSDGGSIALVGAGAMPERVAGLITMAAHVSVDALTIKGIHEARERYQTTDLAQRLARRHGERGKQLFDAWQDTWLDETFQQRMNFEPWLANIGCPALVMQGDKDEYGLPDQVYAIVERIGARAQPVLIPEAGHFPHVEQPEFVLTAISDFLASRVAESIERY